MFKKWTALLMVLVLVMGTIPAGAFAVQTTPDRVPEPAVPMGTTDDGIQYWVYDDHVKITGYTGNKEDLVIPARIEGLPVTVIGECAFFRGDILTSVTIPEGVTEIGESAFEYCRYLTSVTIPQSVTAIGANAFDYCLSLRSVTIPKGVKVIEMYTFDYCIALTSVTIPEGVTTIGKGAFRNCMGLRSVTISDGVTSIGNYAFAACYSLTSVTIPASVTSIGIAPFYKCDALTEIQVDKGNPNYTNDSHGVLFNREMTELLHVPGGISGAYSIPKGVTTIGASAFAACANLTGVTIPEGVTEIQMSAFDSCTGLKAVSIPDSVTVIGDEAFLNCTGLTSVTLPDGVTAISYAAFRECTGLTGITIPAGVTEIGPYAFALCTGLTNVTIPDRVAYIGEGAFVGCDALTTVTIPKGVISIDSKAFGACDALTGIHVDGSNPNYSSDSRGVLFNKEKTELLQAPGAISGAYSIQEGVTEIGVYSFSNCKKLTAVTIPKTVTNIYAEAFRDCLALREIKFCGCAPEMAYSIFEQVTATVYYPAGNATWTDQLMNRFDGAELTWVAFAHTHEYEAVITWPTCTEQGFTTYTCRSCSDIYVEDYVDPLGHNYVDGVCAHCGEEVPIDGFRYQVYEDHAEITEYIGSSTDLLIPVRIQGKPVTVICDYAFDWCTNLTSVVIPKGVVTIGNSAFASCEALTYVKIPTSVTQIGASAFRSCTSLPGIKLPGSVVSIGDNAFSRCNNLAQILVDESNRYYSSDSRGVLFNKDKTTLIQAPGGIEGSYSIPEEVAVIGAEAFYFCDGLTEVKIPEGIIMVGESAFSCCYGLTEIEFPQSLAILGRWAFDDCKNLTGFCVDEHNRYFSSDSSGVLFNKEKTELLRAPGALSGTYSIPESVVSIRNSAFEDCADLTGISIPEHVAHIGDYAFSGCEGLTDVRIPENVSKISSGAFYSCTGLTHVEIPEGVTEIDQFAFASCSGLTDVTLPDSLTKISYGAFQSCIGLTDVTIPKQVSHIGSFAFCDCTGLTEIEFCGDAPYIDTYAFYGVAATVHCPAENPTWTAQVRQNYGGQLNWIVIDHDHVYEVVRTAPTCTSRGCTVHICACGYRFETDYVDALGHDYADGRCTRCALEEAAEGFTYAVYDDHVIITGYIGEKTELVIPEKITGLPVTGIGRMAFYLCDSLYSITIPASVTNIEEGAFLACTMLNGFSVDEDNPNYSSDSYGVLFDKEKTQLIQAPGTMEGTYVIPDTVTSIGDSAFYFIVNLTNVTIPEGVAQIGDSAFALCWNLSSVAIPKSVTSIGNHAFAGCTYMTGIHVDEDNPSYSSDSYGVLFDKEKTQLIQAPRMLSGTYSIPDGVAVISDDAFAYCSGLTRVTIPEGVSIIGKNAFLSCEGMTDVVLPEGVAVIGQKAFSDCKSLTGMMIPDSVVYIGEEAFSHCESLAEVTFCADAPAIEANAFYLVTANVNYPAGDPTWIQYKRLSYGGALTWTAYGHAHAYAAVNTAPTCTQQGYTTYTCACGDSCIGDYVDALGHSYGSWVRIRKPTMDQEGLEERSCRACGHTEQRSIDKLEHPFVDVKEGAFYYAPMLWAVKNGITSGMTATTFAPDNQCTRGQVVTFLWRAAGKPEPTVTEHPFVDVSQKAFYYKAMLWAVEQGITSGMDATHFAPDAYCSRAQVVTFLYRAKGKPQITNTTHPFVDVSEKGFYYMPMLWAVENGITSGMSATTFAPDRICTRGQVVTFLYRAFSN